MTVLLVKSELIEKLGVGVLASTPVSAPLVSALYFSVRLLPEPHGAATALGLGYTQHESSISTRVSDFYNRPQGGESLKLLHLPSTPTESFGKKRLLG